MPGLHCPHIPPRPSWGPRTLSLGLSWGCCPRNWPGWVGGPPLSKEGSGEVHVPPSCHSCCPQRWSQCLPTRHPPGASPSSWGPRWWAGLCPSCPPERKGLPSLYLQGHAGPPRTAPHHLKGGVQPGGDLGVWGPGPRRGVSEDTRNQGSASSPTPHPGSPVAPWAFTGPWLSRGRIWDPSLVSEEQVAPGELSLVLERTWGGEGPWRKGRPLDPAVSSSLKWA